MASRTAAKGSCWRHLGFQRTLVLVLVLVLVLLVLVLLLLPLDVTAARRLGMPIRGVTCTFPFPVLSCSELRCWPFSVRKSHVGRLSRHCALRVA